MKLTHLGAFAAICLPVSVSAGPSQCWYYLHNRLKDKSVQQCVEKAEKALSDRGYTPIIGESSDKYIIDIRSETDDISANVLCYEVNGTRGKVMAFITVAGNGSCAVAGGIFNSMSEN